MARLRLLPEWAPVATVHVGWPSDPAYWGDAFAPAQAETAAFVRALSAFVDVKLNAATDDQTQVALDQVGDIAQVRRMPMGDIWFRDTGPVFGLSNGRPAARAFRFNGWGGKYKMPGDEVVADSIAAEEGVNDIAMVDLVSEGGAFEHDGAGTFITTRACLLHDNRNPGLSQAEAEARLSDTFEIKRIIWLDRGLAGDHTDGHVDNVARFIAPGVVLCQRPSGPDDPNTQLYAEVVDTLTRHGLEVLTIPSPGRIVDTAGAPLPASHLNFVFANNGLIAPTYESDYALQALIALQRIFRGREAIPLPARHLLEGGGGAFHCMTRDVPKAVSEKVSS